MGRELVGETIGKIVTPVGHDGAAFRPILVDTLGRPVAVVGNDGTTYRVLKCNALGQVEVLISGKVPDSELLDGMDSTAFVLKAGDTMGGALTLAAAPTVDLHAATKKYVDDNAVSPGTLLKHVWCSDAPPASANAKDDEFSDLSFNAVQWTHFDPGNVVATSEPVQGACLEAITSAGDKIGGEMQAVSDADFTIWTKVSLLGSVANTLTVGLALWEDGILNPATSDIVTFGFQVQAANWYIKSEKWSAYTTWLSTLFSVQYTQPVSALYLRLRQNGNVWEMDFSTDGVGWYWKHSVARPFTPKEVGMFIDNNGTGVTARAIFPFFRFLNVSQNVRTPPEGRLIHLWG